MSPLVLRGTVTAKKCPKAGCNGMLIIRQNRKRKTHFLGCENWSPDPEGCNYTEPLPEDVKMLAMGAQKLPGFE